MDQIKTAIENSKNVLLHCHPSPDPDSVGSALAMKFALEQLGKKVTLIKGDSDIPKAFSFPGIDSIVQKNFFEIDLKEFDLFIILDSGSKEMISNKAEIIFPEHLNTLVIDHHFSNKGFGKVNFVDSSYSSCCELLFNIFKFLGINITHDIALNLFIGIYTDTGGFRYGKNGDKTLKVASELASIAPDYQKVISIMENSNTKESLVFEALAMSSIKTFFDDKFVIASIRYEDLVKNNIKDDDRFTGGIINKIKSVVTTQIALTIVEVEPNSLKLSFRTRDENIFDVSKIAVALGGGGHKPAAGAKLKMSVPDAIEKVVNMAKEIYNL